MEVEVKIRGLLMDPVTNMPIVVLKDMTGESVLPIWVGVFEANSIALEIEKTRAERPISHDLIKNMLDGFRAAVRKVSITAIEDETFYAVVWVEREGHMHAFDARPSDALALALRCDAPIYVDIDVLHKARINEDSTQQLPPEELNKLLGNIGDDDLGNIKM
jgi:bifunctional DNase/RNase